jgi:hypothetical protein
MEPIKKDINTLTTLNYSDSTDELSNNVKGTLSFKLYQPLLVNIREDITDRLLKELKVSLYKAYLQNINSFRDNSIRIKLDTDLYYRDQDVRSPIYNQLYWDNELN